MLNKVPGLLLTISIAILAKLIAPFLGQIGSITTAIILGMIISNTIPLSSSFTTGIRFSDTQVLNLAVMLLGFNLQLKSLSAIGVLPLLIIVLMQGITILSGIGLGRLFGFSKKTSLLLGVGNAVCGSSAIAAVSPIIKAEESDTGISIGVVNFLGTIGIFVIPALAVKVLSFSDIQTSTFIGGSLQAIGQVVAAGFSVNDRVGEISTIIKMARVAMLGPIILIISLLMNKKKSKDSNAKKMKKKNLIPAIIVWFIIFSIVRSLADYSQLSKYIHWSNISHISKFILTVGMVGIGMKIKFADLLKQGPKSLTVGLLIFIVQLLSLAVLISLLFHNQQLT